MALSGSIGEFPLEDVLTLIATTEKSGCLSVSAPDATGRAWFAKGLLVAHDVPGASDPRDALFCLLRRGSGEFRFESAPPPADGYRGIELPPLLDEWRTVAALLPSTLSSIRLLPALNGSEVSLSAQEWCLVTAIAGLPDASAGGDPILEAIASRAGTSVPQAASGLVALSERGLATLYPALDLAPAEGVAPVRPDEPPPVSLTVVPTLTPAPDPVQDPVPEASTAQAVPDMLPRGLRSLDRRDDPLFAPSGQTSPASAPVPRTTPVSSIAPTPPAPVNPTSTDPAISVPEDSVPSWEAPTPAYLDASAGMDAPVTPATSLNSAHDALSAVAFPSPEVEPGPSYGAGPGVPDPLRSPDAIVHQRAGSAAALAGNLAESPMLGPPPPPGPPLPPPAASAPPDQPAAPAAPEAPSGPSSLSVEEPDLLKLFISTVHQ